MTRNDEDINIVLELTSIGKNERNIRKYKKSAFPSNMLFSKDYPTSFNGTVKWSKIWHVSTVKVV